MGRLLFYLMAGMALYGLWKSVRTWILTPPPADKTRESTQGSDMVRDPTCGIYLPKDRALHRQVNGSMLFFCSDECARKYAADSSKAVS